MNQNYQLFESSLLLTSEQHVPSQDLSLRLKMAARMTGPFYKVNDRISIDDARTRRSRTNHSVLTIAELAELLHLSMFETDSFGERPYPAAGGIYTVSLYLLVYEVEGLEPGVYFVRWSDRSLELIDTAASALNFRDHSLHQENKHQIPVLGLMVADTRRSQVKYHDRSWRMAMIEAGALLQTLYLASTKLDLTLCGLGAVADRAALTLCRLNPSSEIHLACGLALGGKCRL